MRAYAAEQSRIVRELAARTTKPHPEFASPLYVQNLHRTIRSLANALVREIEGKAEIAAALALLVEGDGP
ncbi:MAG: hypothetical protein H0T51_15065 [Pirellulales bacterium]|nr:hypothetical protein [Pirellulales bacterium]